MGGNSSGYFQRLGCSTSLQIRSSLSRWPVTAQRVQSFAAFQELRPLPEQGPFAAGLLHLLPDVAAPLGRTVHPACARAPCSRSLARFASLRPEPGRRHTSGARLFVTAPLSGSRECAPPPRRQLLAGDRPRRARRFLHSDCSCARRLYASGRPLFPAAHFHLSWRNHRSRRQSVFVPYRSTTCATTRFAPTAHTGPKPTRRA
jgi:hypothetical protein